MFTGYKSVNTLERVNKDFHNKSYFYVDNFVHRRVLFFQMNNKSAFCDEKRLMRTVPMTPSPGLLLEGEWL